MYTALVSIAVTKCSVVVKRGEICFVSQSVEAPLVSCVCEVEAASWWKEWLLTSCQPGNKDLPRGVASSNQIMSPLAHSSAEINPVTSQ